MSTQATFSRRTFLTRLITVSVALPAVAACAPPNRPPHQASAAAGGTAAPPVAGGQIALLITADPLEEAAYRTLLTAFQATASQVTVELVNMPSLSDMYRRLLLDFASGTPADLFLLTYRRYPAFAAKQTLAALTPYLAASTAISAPDFYDQAIDAFTWQQHLFGIPHNLSGMLLYYNKTIFDAAGVAYPQPDWSWDDCVQTAQALTLDQDRDGIIDVWGLGTDAITLRVAPFIWMAGGDLVDDPEHPTQLALDTPAARQALAWFVALQTEHGVVPDPVTEKAESHEARFISGRLAMYLESRRVTPSLRQNTQFDWDVAPLPRLQQRTTVLHADAFCMAAQSQHKAAAWSLIEYATAPSGQTVLTQTGRVVPANKQAATSPAFLDPATKPANGQHFLDALAYTRRLPLLPTWPEIEAGIGRELELAFHGDSTLDAAIDAAYIRTREFFLP